MAQGRITQDSRSDEPDRHYPYVDLPAVPHRALPDRILSPLIAGSRHVEGSPESVEKYLNKMLAGRRNKIRLKSDIRKQYTSWLSNKKLNPI